MFTPKHTTFDPLIVEVFTNITYTERRRIKSYNMGVSPREKWVKSAIESQEEMKL